LEPIDAEEHRTAYKQVLGLSRGLSVLQALVDCPNGQATPATVARITGLHRTTVRRLMETLRAEGFVRRSDSDGSFMLTIRIRRMGESLTDQEWVTSIAAPILRDLSARVVWPCDLAIPDGEAMLIRDSTHHFSPLSFHRGMIGSRLPMFRTAMGRAYLAFSRQEVCDAVLRMVAENPDPTARSTGSPLGIQAILAQTRKQGYGLNIREWKPHERTAALALPIMSEEGNVVACVNIIVNTVAFRIDRLEAELLPPLREAADAVQLLIKSR
jgi:IclR family mhp operon transcriptional activator